MMKLRQGRRLPSDAAPSRRPLSRRLPGLLFVWACAAAALAVPASSWPADTNDFRDEYTGPDDWVERTGYGGLGPLTDRQLSLRKLRVGIGLRESQGSGYYVARADYTLENTGPARELTLEIPMEWKFSAEAESRRMIDAPPKGWAERQARLVKLSVNGRAVKCRVHAERVVAEAPYAYAGPVLLGVCAARVKVPAARRVSVVAETTGFLRSAAGDQLQLGYWLAPHGAWPDPVDVVQIEVDLGFYAPFVKVGAPAGGVLRGKKVRWSLSEAVLGPLTAVKVVVAGGFSDLVEGYGWVRRGPAAVMSFPGGEPIGALTDGDPETKWCASLQPHSKITLEGRFPIFEVPRHERCAVRDVEWAVDWFRRANRVAKGPAVTAFRISTCARPDDGIDVEWPGREARWQLRNRLDEGLPAEIAFPAGVMESSPDCVRFEITRTDPRASGRFCLGELNPRVYCRDERVKRPSLLEAWRMRGELR